MGQWLVRLLGCVFWAQGNSLEALARYQAVLAMREQLAKRDPANAGWQHDIQASLGRIAEVAISQGNLPLALASVRRRYEIMERLATVDLANARWRRDLTLSREMIGDVLVAQGNLAEALTN